LSSVRVVTSISDGWSAWTYVNGVPQAAQNVLTTGGEEWNSAGLPATKEKTAAANVTHATAGEPAALAHVWQWQTMLTVGPPRA
jgi:hypothetical protein